MILGTVPVGPIHAGRYHPPPPARRIGPPGTPGHGARAPRKSPTARAAATRKEGAVNDLGTLTGPRVCLGKVHPLRLPELLRIEEQAPAPCWGRQDLLAALQAEGTGVAVAEFHHRIIGFA